MPRFADLPEPVMDKSDMQRSVDSLRSQLNIERTPISQSATDLPELRLPAVTLCKQEKREVYEIPVHAPI
ncbi:hypothetical protein ANCCEY_04766 [Ancylostoma ceylanicum]|uniref:Uncharacterized protein n=1 Tax=Ancylostoma ceylanicum TaxID=53326 RepID=A0A0D6LVS2_9BILA|nr:hypothetical protein ANCCEY_04766 [Ancylostoma ceylanicum]